MLKNPQRGLNIMSSLLVVQEPCKQIRYPFHILLVTGDFRTDLHYIIIFKRKSYFLRPSYYIF